MLVVELYALIQFIFPWCQSSFCGKQTGKKLVTSVLSTRQGAVSRLSRLSIVPSCVLWNLTLTRNLFLRDKITGSCPTNDRNEFLETIRLASFQKPTITTKNKIV